MGEYRDNGKENGSYYIIIGYILGLYRDNGKEHGSYYPLLGLYIMQKKIELLHYDKVYIGGLCRDYWCIFSGYIGTMERKWKLLLRTCELTEGQ